jgi:hypothetical protein
MTTPTEPANPLEIAQRYQIVALLAAWAVAGTRWWRKARIRPAERYLHLYVLGALWLIYMPLYDLFEWRDYRLFAPFLLISMLLMIVTRRLRWLAGAVIAVNILLTPVFLQRYRELREVQFFPDHEQISNFSDVVEEYLTFDAETDNPWCNSLLISGYGSELVTLPPGMGFSAIINPVFVEFPVKSRYLLLRDDIYAQLEDGLNVERLATTSLGGLYRNRDAACG